MATIIDYAILPPDWFIRELQLIMNRFDLKNMCGCGAITVSDEHPFVMLAGAISKDPNVNPSSILPALAVVERTTTEEPFIGQSAPNDEEHTQILEPGCLECVPVDLNERYQDFLVSDADLRQISDWLQNGPLAANVTKFYQRESVLITLWCEFRQQRTFLGVILNHAVHELRTKLSRDHKVIDSQFKIQRGLIHRDFGRILRGLEISFDFTNWMSLIEIDGSPPTSPTSPVVTINSEYVAQDSGDEPTRIRCSD